MGEEEAQAWRKGVAAAILACAAGFFDAAAFVGLGEVFVANMSGNTVRLAIEGEHQEWMKAAVRAWPIALFMIGLMLSGAVFSFGARRKLRSLRYVLGAELVLIAATTALALTVFPAPYEAEGASYFALAAISAFTMGLQNGAVRHVGEHSIFTTHVTGSLAKFGESVVEGAFKFHDLGEEEPSRSALSRAWAVAKDEPGRSALLMGSLWLAFLAGAVLAAACVKAIGMFALAIPLASVGAVLAMDLHRPFAEQP